MNRYEYTDEQAQREADAINAQQLDQREAFAIARGYVSYQDYADAVEAGWLEEQAIAMAQFLD